LYKTNTGFISAEGGFTEDEEGNIVWNLWEAWENKEDFDNYNTTPERVEGSEFMTEFLTLLSGALSMLWLNDFARVNP
jgi:quinol monooxygenase YgiN